MEQPSKAQAGVLSTDGLFESIVMKLPKFRTLHRFFLAISLLLLVCQPAFAQKRVALVLGNADYQNVAPLSNPVNDGAVIAATLKRAGFDVVDARYNLAAADTRRALRDFGDIARGADIAVIYYAGHGVEVDGTNYLIPVDAKLERDTDVYDEAFPLDRVLLAVAPAKQLQLVILDACRDNPFARNMKKTVASRSIGRGLARIEPASSNTLIAYSAKAGSTALDGDSKNSPFTMALARYIATPGLDVRKAFGLVRDDVLKNTGNRQEPFVYGSLGGDDVSLVPVIKPAVASGPEPTTQSEVRRDYELAQQVGNADALSAFLARYPDGFYADLAKIQLARIAAEQARATATENARLAEQERARLAAEGAQKAQQLQAEAEARAAEQARITAEAANKLAQEHAVEAERSRIASDAPAANAAAGGSGRPQAEKPVSVASLTAGPSQSDLVKSVQSELRRVGCLTGEADGAWKSASQRSLALFNRHAGTKLDVKVASTDALDAIKLKDSRVCPLACEHGFKADGDHCSKIVCAEGSFLNEDNECEKRRAKTPIARRQPDERPDRGTRQHPAPARVQASGQIVCDSNGCRPVARGCHLEYRTTAQGGPREGGGGNVQICN
jgi:hypothetical protein